LRPPAAAVMAIIKMVDFVEVPAWPNGGLFPST
jgi:hypothetical protein